MAEIKSMSKDEVNPVEVEAKETSPSDEELRTLRRVAGPLPWPAFTVAFVELCERFSYYGTTAVCMLPFLRNKPLNTNEIVVNFIQRPLPDGSTTGAGYDGSVPGALGMGQRASTGLTLCELDWLAS